MSTITGLLGGGGGSSPESLVTFTANENISIGQAVAVRSDGKIEKTNNEYPDQLVDSQAFTVSSGTNTVLCLAFNNDKTVFALLRGKSSSNHTIQIFSYTEATKTWTTNGTEYTIPDSNSGTLTDMFEVKWVESQSVFVAAGEFYTGAGFYRPGVIAFSVSGGVPTFGTPVTFSFGTPTGDAQLYDFEVDQTNGLCFAYGVYVTSSGIVNLVASYKITGTSLSRVTTQDMGINDDYYYKQIVVANGYLWLVGFNSTNESQWKGSRFTINSSTGALSGLTEFFKSNTIANALSVFNCFALGYVSSTDKVTMMASVDGGLRRLVWDPTATTNGDVTTYTVSSNAEPILQTIGSDQGNGDFYFFYDYLSITNTVYRSGGATTGIGTAIVAISNLPKATTKYVHNGVIASITPYASTSLTLRLYDATILNNWYDFIGVAAENITANDEGQVIVNGGIGYSSTTFTNITQGNVYPSLNGSFQESSDRTTSKIGETFGPNKVYINRIT